MKNHAIIGVLCAVTAFSISSRSEDITTFNGKTYTNVKRVKYNPVGVTVSHDSGISTIPFADIPSPVRERYGYDYQKEALFIKAEKQRKIENEKQRKLAEKWKDATEEMSEIQPEVGMYGTLKHVEVVQVINRREVLVLRRLSSDANGNSYLVWIQGISTKGLVDGVVFSPSVPLVFTGTKTYVSALQSSKTVILAQPMSKEDFLSIGR